MRTAALAALVSASGALPALHRDIPWSGEVWRRGKEPQRGEWGARVAGDAVAALAAAMLATTIAVSVGVGGAAGGGSDGGGGSGGA